MKFYVASKVENLVAVKKLIALLTSMGHVVTEDWTEKVATDLTGAALRQYLQARAVEDYNGVVTCDVLVFLNHPRCAGSFTEFGIALPISKIVVVVGAWEEDNPSNVFFHLPDVHHFDTDEEAAEFVNECERRKGERPDALYHPLTIQLDSEAKKRMLAAIEEWKSKPLPMEQWGPELRPALMWFAMLMEQKLRHHDSSRGESGWRGDESLGLIPAERQDLVHWIKSKLEKLNTAVLTKDPISVTNAAVDIANLAMMVADLWGETVPEERKLFDTIG
jgi:hypothetical protein